MQKQLAPMGYHYKSEESLLKSKLHLEHVIPQNKIITAYLHDKIKAQLVLQMPLCLIDDIDKHILEGDWQQSGNWHYPFRRYHLAGYNKIIKDVRGKGLWIGMELNESEVNAKDLCLMLLNEGLLCKETHKTVIRFAPPLMISKDDLDWAIKKITKVIRAI